jgi:DNA-directed RNA polymerase subunit N (RpoN/RPB10)
MMDAKTFNVTTGEHFRVSHNLERRIAALELSRPCGGIVRKLTVTLQATAEGDPIVPLRCKSCGEPLEITVSLADAAYIDRGVPVLVKCNACGAESWTVDKENESEDRGMQDGGAIAIGKAMRNDAETVAIAAGRMTLSMLAEQVKKCGEILQDTGARITAMEELQRKLSGPYRCTFCGKVFGSKTRRTNEGSEDATAG